MKCFATPQRCYDLENIFRNYTLQLSEIFSETVDEFVSKQEHLITGKPSVSYMARRASALAVKVKEKMRALEKCVGFIDETVLEKARPDITRLQNVV